MRVLTLMLLGLSTGFAPAPLYKSPLTDEQQALLVEAEGYLVAARRALEEVRDLTPDSEGVDETLEEYKKNIRMFRQRATASVSLLHKKLGKATGLQKLAIARKMGPAWAKIRGYKKALPYFEDILAHSADPPERDIAFLGARGCLISLGRIPEAEKFQRSFPREFQRMKKHARATDPALPDTVFDRIPVPPVLPPP